MRGLSCCSENHPLRTCSRLIEYLVQVKLTSDWMFNGSAHLLLLGHLRLDTLQKKEVYLAQNFEAETLNNMELVLKRNLWLSHTMTEDIVAGKGVRGR